MTEAAIGAKITVRFSCGCTRVFKHSPPEVGETVWCPTHGQEVKVTGRVAK